MVLHLVAILFFISLIINKIIFTGNEGFAIVCILHKLTFTEKSQFAKKIDAKCTQSEFYGRLSTVWTRDAA